MLSKSQILIGQLAQQSGLSRDTLRFYEKEGILRSERLANNYRVYNQTEVTRLRFVETARASGFSLREARQILNLVNMGKKSCTDYEEVARAKLKDLDMRINALMACRNTLAESLQCCKSAGSECSSLAGI